MSELELDVLRAFREIAPDILTSNVQSGDSVTFALSFYYHGDLLFNFHRVESQLTTEETAERTVPIPNKGCPLVE